MSTYGITVGLLLVTSTLGCGADPFTPAPCSDEVALSISAEAVPSISWRPECGAAGLTVDAIDGSGISAWEIITFDQANRLEPPIRYGELPNQAVEPEDAKPLVSGVRYRVTVLASEPTSDGGLALGPVGSVEIVP